MTAADREEVRNQIADKCKRRAPVKRKEAPPPLDSGTHTVGVLLGPKTYELLRDEARAAGYGSGRLSLFVGDLIAEVLEANPALPCRGGDRDRALQGKQGRR